MPQSISGVRGDGGGGGGGRGHTTVEQLLETPNFWHLKKKTNKKKKKRGGNEKREIYLHFQPSYSIIFGRSERQTVKKTALVPTSWSCFHILARFTATISLIF